MLRFARHKVTADEAVDVSESNGVRALHLGSVTIQSAMRIKDPFALELTYTREFTDNIRKKPAHGLHVFLHDNTFHAVYATNYLMRVVDVMITSHTQTGGGLTNGSNVYRTCEESDDTRP